MPEYSDSDVLIAPNILEYPYSRSTGPVIGHFMTALRDGRIEGIRTGDGRVLCPPTEYDPATGESLSADATVDVGPGGAVTTWAWVAQPRAQHLLDRPFAFALIRLDGADTALLHMVDAGKESAMQTGMRVQPRWRDERVGEIQDIEAFVPETAAEPVTKIDTPVELEYRFTAGRAASRFLRNVEQGKLVGQRCPQCKKVYCPPRGACAACGVPTDEEVELGDTGTVTTFCVVNVPFYGQQLEIPYVSATILMDGADIGLMHLIQEAKIEDVHMGMRVEAVWVEPEERKPTLESIKYFRPTGEPDADFETYRAHV